MLSSPSWDDLKLILAIARTGSLLGAARALQVNASTIGRRLDALEEAFGIRIFDRTRQGIAITELAEQLIPFAEAAEQAASGFLWTIEGHEQKPEGIVRISAPPGVASLVLAPRLIELHARYPELQIQVDAEVGYADLSRRETDIALRAHRPTSGDLISKCLLSVPYAVMMHSDTCPHSPVQSWDELKWIDWGPGLSHMVTSIWLRERVSKEQIIIHSDSIDVQAQAALSGLGAWLTSEPLGLQSGLQMVPLADHLQKEVRELPLGSVWLVGHRALRHVPRISVVWEFIVELFQWDAHPEDKHAVL